MQRKKLLALLLLCLIATAPVLPRASGQDQESSFQISKAENYLIDNYNVTIGLIHVSPETSNLSNTYFLYTDNLLATMALHEWYQSQTNATVARVLTNISATMSSYAKGLPNLKNDMMALNGSVYAFGISSNYVLTEFKGAAVELTLNNGTSQLSPKRYADIALLQSIYYYKSGNLALASNDYALAANMWDGQGFVDAAYKSTSGYQTYKAALFLIAQVYEKRQVDAQVANTLLEMQNATSGGFFTAYNSVYGHLNSVTNTETTSLCILALSSYYASLKHSNVTTEPVVFNLPFIGEITFYVLLVVVATAGFAWKMIGRRRH